MPDIDAAYQREFVEIEGWRPEVNWRVAVTGRPLEVLSERHYDAAREQYGTDAYEEHIRRWDGLYGCQTTLMRDAGLLVGLATLRTEREGKTSKRDRDTFAEGATFALAAVRMQYAMAGRGAAMLAGALDTIGVAAFLLGRDGKVAALSARAEAMVARAGTPLILRHGQLGAARRDADRLLQTALSHALRGEPAQQLWIGPSCEGGEGGLCEVFQLPAREWNFGFDPHVLVVMRSAGEIPEARLGPLREALGFTPAEAEIALQLANGAAREQVALERGTSQQTLHGQIKSILRKSDVTREAELVALINRLMR